MQPPTPTDPSELDRLAEYMAGALTPVERAEVDAWIADHPEWAALVAYLGQAKAANSPSLTPHVTQLRQALAAESAQPAVPRIPSHRPETRASGMGRRVWAGAAAAVALVAAVVVGRFGSHPESPVPVQRYATPAGQMTATVTLPNGATAVLGPATSLEVTADRTRGTVVRVIGEALFTVRHDRRVPFVVHTSAATTTVLGTTFLVRQYPLERSARVVVQDGRVSVHAATPDLYRAASHGASRGAVLVANMLGVIDDSGAVFVTPNIAVDDHTAWATGRLVFRKTPVRDIVLELGRAYDADIRVTDSTLATQTLTWTVPVARQPLAGALGALAEVLGARVLRSGDQITLVPAAPHAPARRATPTPSTSEIQYGK